jgi:hypothetical protein
MPPDCALALWGSYGLCILLEALCGLSAVLGVVKMWCERLSLMGWSKSGMEDGRSER